MTTTEQLRALLAKATPGPLSIDEYGDIKSPGLPKHGKLLVDGVSIPCGYVRDNCVSRANRDLIVAAVNNLPAFLKVVEAAKAMTLVDSYDDIEVSVAQDRIDEALREFEGLNNSDKETK